MECRQGLSCHTWRRASPLPAPARAGCGAVAPVCRSKSLAQQQQGKGSRRAFARACATAHVQTSLLATLTSSVDEQEDGPLSLPVNSGEPGQDSVCAAYLATRLTKAHTASLTAALVVQDTSGWYLVNGAARKGRGRARHDSRPRLPRLYADEKLIATASLDKGMACWRLYRVSWRARESSSHKARVHAWLTVSHFPAGPRGWRGCRGANRGHAVEGAWRARIFPGQNSRCAT